MKTIGEELKRVRGKHTQAEMAEHVGVHTNTLKNYESGARVPDIDFLISFADATGEDFLYWLELRVAESKARGADTAKALLDAAGDLHVARQPLPPPYGFVLVPRYDVAASMGHGSVIHSEQIVDHLAFREEWVRTELSANPKNLVLISAIGDSMEPTLRAGDLLLVDRSSEGVTQDAIYAFATNGELRVKRMQLKIDGSVVIKSDNLQYEAETLLVDQVGSLRIIGRVVWSGRRM